MPNIWLTTDWREREREREKKRVDGKKITERMKKEKQTRNEWRRLRAFHIVFNVFLFFFCVLRKNEREREKIEEQATTYYSTSACMTFLCLRYIYLCLYTVNERNTDSYQSNKSYFNCWDFWTCQKDSLVFSNSTQVFRQ